MTHEEARAAAKSRWGPDGDAIHQPWKPIPCYIGYWHEPPFQHRQFSVVACGQTWESTFKAAEDLRRRNEDGQRNLSAS